jgi:gamma-glutamylaminecyclotransferase
MPYIFVYGTLRKGLYNNWLLKESRFIGLYKTTNVFYMATQKSRAFPLISPEPILSDTTPCKIVGEIYDVSLSVLEHLDNLEGHPHTYVRAPIQIDDFTEPVEAYILDSMSIRDDIRQSGRYQAIRSGDFAEQP